MSLLFESIKLQDGRFFRLPYHQQRIDAAFAALFPDDEPFSLYDSLTACVLPQEGIFKCRVVYDNIVRSVDFTPYVRRDIQSLRLVSTDMQSCSYKLEERSGFQQAFAQRAGCDDVILVRDGLLTDSSYSNIALFDGTKWFTPAVPLLYGTNRAELLHNERISPLDISVANLHHYTQICLFNAMVEFGELVLPIDVVCR